MMYTSTGNAQVRNCLLRSCMHTRTTQLTRYVPPPQHGGRLLNVSSNTQTAGWVLRAAHLLMKLN